MNVLVLGGGSREHALAWKLAQSPKLDEIYAAPINPGIAEVAQEADIDVSDFGVIEAFCIDKEIGLVVVGPEQALVDGIVDYLTDKGIATFGPDKAAARIEGSKAFAKELMKKHGIPTASYETFTDYESAKTYIESQGAPIVIKASGLAAGKGAVVCKTDKEAQDALSEIMQDEKFGDAGSEVVIEEFMEGPEVSIHVLADGEHYKIFPESQDNKAIFDGSKGPNTGGMGTISPLADMTDTLQQRIEDEIVAPIMRAMADDGHPYTGLLYPGIMVTKDGPKVVEFNCRFGDPEVQVYMARLESDLLELMMACTSQTLDAHTINWSDHTAVNVVLASGGYPGSYEKGKEITGIEKANSQENVTIFQAGTKADGDKIVTNGGRVISVTATGKDLDEARKRAYDAADMIDFEGKQLRSDIGLAHDNSKLKEH